MDDIVRWWAEALARAEIRGGGESFPGPMVFTELLLRLRKELQLPDQDNSPGRRDASV